MSDDINKKICETELQINQKKHELAHLEDLRKYLYKQLREKQGSVFIHWTRYRELAIFFKAMWEKRTPKDGMTCCNEECSGRGEGALWNLTGFKGYALCIDCMLTNKMEVAVPKRSPLDNIVKLDLGCFDEHMQRVLLQHQVVQ